MGQPGERPARWTGGVLRVLDLPQAMRIAALASVIVNVLIVVTGGAVRLTESGLGCPTWPTCTDDSLVPTSELAEHGLIEFSNRLLTFAVGAVAVATVIIALIQRRSRGREGTVRARLAIAILLGIPAQAVLGGITVLTDLNPWLVGCHFLLSMVLIALAVLLLDRTGRQNGHGISADTAAVARRAVAWLVVVTCAVVLVLGTAVTGSGPHAGATTDEGVAHRNGLDPAGISQAHADAVMILIGLTLGAIALAYIRPSRARAIRAAWILLVAELAQGLIGYIQYFTDLPIVLVGLHMLGSCLVWIAALHVLLHAQQGRPHRAAAPAQLPPDEGAPETTSPAVSAPSWAHGVSPALTTSAPGTSA